MKEQTKEYMEGDSPDDRFIELLSDFKKRFDVFKKIATSLMLGLVVVICIQLALILWVYLKL